MECFYRLVNEANKAFRTADHLTYITYPLLNDKKLIIKITEHIYDALSKSIDAILYYERLYKRIQPLPQEFLLRFHIFKDKCSKRYDISNEELLFIQELRELIELHKRSQMEFIRNDKYVIYSNSIALKTINLITVKKYLSKTRPFINKLNQIIENDRRYQ